MYGKYLCTLLILLATNAMATNNASINLESETASESLDLSFTDAFVAQGSYSGIRMIFSTCCEDSDHRKLSLFIPSHNGFGIGYDSSIGDFISSIPQIPFVFHSEHSRDVHDRRGRPRPMGITLSNLHKIGKQHWSDNRVEFSDCKLSVSAMSIENRKLAFTASFDCRSEQPAYNASGMISITDAELGVSKVD